jgi:hypothetical protein
VRRYSFSSGIAEEGTVKPASNIRELSKRNEKNPIFIECNVRNAVILFKCINSRK